MEGNSRSAVPARYDALDPLTLDDPYPTYARLRQAGAVCRAGAGQWCVPRYAEVAAFLGDPRLGHQYPDAYHRLSIGDGAAATFRERILVNRDPPDHTRLRKVMLQAFHPALVRRLGERIRGLVDELLAPALDGAPFDVVRDLAYPLPITVVCELIGVPPTDRDLLRPRAVDLAKAFGTLIPQHDRAAAHEAVTWLRLYMEKLLAQRRVAPRDDLLSHMLAAEQGGERLTHEEIVDNTVFLFFAGFDTTTNLIAGGCAALLRHPGELARMRADLALVPTAIEEFLRYEAPIQSVARLILQPIEIDGRMIRPGRVLTLLLGSANHDERQFADPGRLDIGRKPNAHVSFGGGIHHCLGATLARIEGAVVFEQLARRFRRLESDGDAVRRLSPTFRSWASLPMRARPA